MMHNYPQPIKDIIKYNKLMWNIEKPDAVQYFENCEKMVESGTFTPQFVYDQVNEIIQSRPRLQYKLCEAMKLFVTKHNDIWVDEQSHPYLVYAIKDTGAKIPQKLLDRVKDLDELYYKEVAKPGTFLHAIIWDNIREFRKAYKEKYAPKKTPKRKSKKKQVVEEEEEEKKEEEEEDRNDDFSLIKRAARFGAIKVYKFMREQLDEDDMNEGILMEACMSDNYKLVKEILDDPDNEGCDLHQYWQDDICRGRCEKMLEYLSGVIRFSSYHVIKNNLLHYYFERWTIHGEMDEKDEYQEETVLMAAAEIGLPMLVEFFIREGCQVNAADGLQRTPLHFAADNHQAEVIEVLLQHGAKITKDYTKKTPLEKCKEKGYQKCIDVFTKFGIKK